MVCSNWDKEFKLYTDASKVGLGAILAQEDDQGQERVISYASCGTKGGQRNYGATQLECLAVVWALDHFRYYLIGRHFRLYTDNSALTWLLKQKEPSGIFARWVMKLQPFVMTVHYRKSIQNRNADVLSQNSILTVNQGEIEEFPQ